MSKLTLEALKERAESVVTNELLTMISGGTENACHDGGSTREQPPTKEQDGTSVRKPIIKGL